MSYECGQEIEAKWEDCDCWYLATILAVNADGTYKVKYLCDGKKASALDPSKMRVPWDVIAEMSRTPRDFKIGDEVEAYFEDSEFDKAWHAADVVWKYTDSTYKVEFRSGEKCKLGADRVRAPWSVVYGLPPPPTSTTAPMPVPERAPRPMVEGFTLFGAGGPDIAITGTTLSEVRTYVLKGHECFEIYRATEDGRQDGLGDPVATSENDAPEGMVASNLVLRIPPPKRKRE